MDLNLNNVLDKNIGYSYLNLSKNDIQIIKNMVIKNFNDIILKNNYSKKKITFKNYLKNISLFQHEALFPKKVRIFKKSQFKKIFNETHIFKRLKNKYPEIQITDEESIGYENLYWRIVRPLPYTDIGPMHKDKWFWDLGHGNINEKKYQRVKIWISLGSSANNLGLKFIKGSPNKKYKYKSEKRHGKIKPLFNQNQLKKDKIISFSKKHGNCIMFNDELLHGGESVKGNICRLSVECTFLINKN
tara:strand:- start:14584 stop:15318 length:735 start_codon:yes stop_codon:yes gene_type:complete